MVSGADRVSDEGTLASASLIIETLLSEAKAFRSMWRFSSPHGRVAVFDPSGELLMVGDVELGALPVHDARAARLAAVPAAKLKALMAGHSLYETSGAWPLGVPQLVLSTLGAWVSGQGLQIQGAVKVDGLGYVATQLKMLDTRFEVQLLDMALSAAGFIRRDWPAGFLDGRKYAFAAPGWVEYHKAEEG